MERKEEEKEEITKEEENNRGQKSKRTKRRLLQHEQLVQHETGSGNWSVNHTEHQGLFLVLLLKPPTDLSLTAACY